MNRKRMIIEGAALGLLFALVLLLLARWYIGQTDQPAEVDQNTPVLDLGYCNDEQIKPCVVSFGLDVDGNMLVNILIPDLTFPGFYLEVTRGEISVSYKCRRITATPKNAYCIGEKLPPGEALQLKLISTRDSTLLAQGTLSIIGLAFPTLEIAIPTEIPTDVSATPDATETPDFILPTRTKVISPTQTNTPPGYPSPSYP